MYVILEVCIAVTLSNIMREVSRARSTPNILRRKERIYGKLNPHYIAGFIDGEGSFSVSIGKHKTLKRGLEVRIEFSIEVRADDRNIIKRIRQVIGCGNIYNIPYRKQGWYPHVKYKIGSRKDLVNYLFPLLDKYPLQAKKKQSYEIFKKVVLLCENKEHLSDKGFEKILKLRNQIRKMGKKAVNRRNR